ncbi:MAG: winged helix-turn-helix domain-containing protein [Acidimicrobiia bacterium]|nr:winged helix-turn-helix domain-containing protein [Acidimicrobiia bacterium]
MTTEATAPTLPFDPLSPPQKAPSASEVFRSSTQTAILQAVHTGHRGLYISELAERIGMAKSSIHHQVESLEAAGIVCSERIGRCRLISLNPDSPTAREISHLLDRFTGVESLLRAALRPVPGIERAFMPGPHLRATELRLSSSETWTPTTCLKRSGRWERSPADRSISSSRVQTKTPASVTGTRPIVRRSSSLPTRE